MRSLLINHIQNARQSIKSSRVRSLLTMLGVTIGVASITTILALSGGAGKVIADQINELGGNIIIVRPGKTANPLSNLTRTQPYSEYTTSTITAADVESINAIPHVQAVAPIMVLKDAVKANLNTSTETTIVATTPALADISNLQLREGQFLDDSIKQNTVVLGTQLSIDLFGTESSVGRILTIHDQPFTVVGVLRRSNNPINYNSVDFDNAAVINSEIGLKMNQNIMQIQQINVKTNSITNLDQAATDIYKVLSQNHGNEDNFSILSGDKISEPANQFFYTITGFTTVIAAISLVVGGIGIMNIMLVTVAERTREIGIRKALGANNSDIMWQFLIESLAISVSGGIFGYISGYLIAFGISRFLTFTPIITWQIAAAAMIISIILGTLSGLYPAIHAALKDPIDSLHRYE